MNARASIGLSVCEWVSEWVSIGQLYDHSPSRYTRKRIEDSTDALDWTPIAPIKSRQNKQNTERTQ